MADLERKTGRIRAAGWKGSGTELTGRERMWYKNGYSADLAYENGRTWRKYADPARHEVVEDINYS